MFYLDNEYHFHENQWNSYRHMNQECWCRWRWLDTGWIHIHRYLSKESCDLRFFESDNFVIHLTPYISLASHGSQNQCVKLFVWKLQKRESQCLSKMSALEGYRCIHQIQIASLRFLLVFKIVHRLQCPEQLTDYLQLRSSLHSRSLRDNTLLHLLKVKTSIGQSTFQYSAAADWNSLPRSIREITSLARFKSKLYNYLRDLDRATHRCSCN